MRTVKEVSKLTGISVRALHHYDAIGLLCPAKVTDAGYRLYDEAALRRLQNILLFRELQFPLKEIKAILDSPEFKPEEALEQQITLLELRRKHIDQLIFFARRIQKEGVDAMSFQAFQTEEIHQYEEEVRKRWGNTEVYKDYQRKTAGKSEEEFSMAADQLMSVFKEIGSLCKLPPEDQKVQEKIEKLQNIITENYYNCTDEILRGLGEMYVHDERMKENIDKAGGEGTARFVNQAIAEFCK